MHKIAIIGLGPRGLSVFDRIIAYARNDASATPLELYVFDGKEFGPGCHTTDQNSHLLVNTVACQMTQFSDDTVRGGGPLLYGPSFADWLSSKSGSAPGAQAGHVDIDRNGYYSRALFGDYLRWCFEYVKKLAPPHVTIYLHNFSTVEDLERTEDGWQVFYDGQAYPADFVFLTTGHARKIPNESERELMRKVDAGRERNPRLQLVLEPYPIRNAVSGVTERDTVAIEGIGLTSFDLLAQLTSARGGIFESCGRMEAAGRLRYRPSGKEPRILLYARSGLPLTARAINQKGVFGQYKAKFLTLAKVEELRAATPGGKLDFQQQIMPLLWCDMQFAYYFSHLHQRHDRLTALVFSNEFLAAESPEARQALIDKHVPRRDQLSWDAMVNPIPARALQSRRQYDDWLRGYMWRDFEQGLLGNLNSPIKSACDVLRDVRDVIRSAIDFAGLTEQSHRWVLSEFLPIMNRLAVGPPKERIAQLLALMDAGVVIADFGPGARSVYDEEAACFVVRGHWNDAVEQANVLVRARASLPGPLEDKSPLMRKMVARGIVKPFMNGSFHPGGITVDRNMNVVSAESALQDSLWALGTLVEGCKFYTFVLPRPGANSTSMVDAGRAVGCMMEVIARRNKERLAAGAGKPASATAAEPAQAIEPPAPVCTIEAWPQQQGIRVPANDLAA